MTQPVGSSTSPNSSYYDPSQEVSRLDGSNAGAGGTGGTGALDGTGGTAGAATSGNAGARGAGNVDETRHIDDWGCIPEAIMVAKECGAAYLLRRVGQATVCAASLGQFAACVQGGE